MDLCADMLLQSLRVGRHAGTVQVEAACPAFRRRVGRLPVMGRRRWALNADRLLNRHWDYPRYLRHLAGKFDLFHVCDHSYAQLVHDVPKDRVGVYCHDLDAFRCLLEPAAELRPRWFRYMMWRVLGGLQKAAVIFHSTAAVRRAIERHGLVDPGKLVHAPYGVSSEFRVGPDDEGARASPGSLGAPYLLHVGSCIPRKRVDVVLEVVAAVRAVVPRLRFVQVGGTWTAEHQKLIRRHGLSAAVQQLRGLDRSALAMLYRRAALVLQPSAAEGFGIPVIEALACGAIVVASDIPVLREVGGEAVVYCPVGDVTAWADTVRGLLTSPQRAPSLSSRLNRAGEYSWQNHARIIADAYRRLLGHQGPSAEAPEMPAAPSAP
jgi:glycosyltransferase involved in cell wall biosynthesis